MRLIDADAFKEYMRKALEETRGCYPDKGEWAEAITEQFCKDIDDQPTIETQQTCEYWDSESKFCALCRPSAQPTVHPQRTCVNCGRTVNNGGWYADGGTRCPIEEHYALPKDGYCHLWEKRNVTDDDYPERQEVDGERRTDE